MTKTLTEQWREGTLPGGFYYLEMNDGLVITDHTIYVVGEKIYRWELSSVDYVKEVIEPAPNYDEYNDLIQQNVNQESAIETYIERIKELEKKLEIATNALEELETKSDKFYLGDHNWSVQEQLDFIKAKCQETLYHIKEIEEVK